MSPGNLVAVGHSNPKATSGHRLVVRKRTNRKIRGDVLTPGIGADILQIGNDMSKMCCKKHPGKRQLPRVPCYVLVTLLTVSIQPLTKAGVNYICSDRYKKRYE